MCRMADRATKRRPPRASPCATRRDCAAPEGGCRCTPAYQAQVFNERLDGLRTRELAPRRDHADHPADLATQVQVRLGEVAGVSGTGLPRPVRLRGLQEEAGVFIALDFSPDGGLLASSSETGKGGIRDVATGAKVASLPTSPPPLEMVAQPTLTSAPTAPDRWPPGTGTRPRAS